ncbi:MAG: hypothetical protein QOD92_745 [Acidimicrobiaceae bacterium]
MLSAMQTRRWVDPSQPQTLQIAVFLLYAQAAFALLFGQFIHLDGFVIVIGGVGAGYGIANERKWGYGLGLLVAIFPFVYRIAKIDLAHVFNTDVVTLMFEIALVFLLLHPQSRDYERIWFK